MNEHLPKTLAVFGVLIAMSMFLNMANYIENQNRQGAEPQIISAFAG